MSRKRLPIRAGEARWSNREWKETEDSDRQGQLESHPIRVVRAVLKLLGLTVWTLGVFLTWKGIDILLGVFSRDRIPWRYGVFQTWSRTAIWILGIRVTIQGKRPQEPFFLVSNHLSYLDIPVLASRLETTFIAKREISNWPVMGRLTRAMGTIFVDRHRKLDVYRVNQVIQKRMEKRESIVLFPEGTSTDGERVVPFHSPLLEEPVLDNWPVHAVSIEYRVREPEVPARETVCYWGDMKFFPHAWTLLQLNSIEVNLQFCKRPLESNSRKQLAPRLEQQVRHQHSRTGTSGSLS